MKVCSDTKRKSVDRLCTAYTLLHRVLKAVLQISEVLTLNELHADGVMLTSYVENAPIE